MVYDALYFLYSHYLTCAAVTSSEGSLVGTISLSDFLELFRTKQHRILSVSIRAFMVHLRSRSRPGTSSSRSETEAVPVVQRNSRASHAIQRMLSSSQKIVWITDSRNRPIGVVYPSDVILVLAS